MLSKTSRFFLWVIIAGLAFIAGLRFYRAYERRAEREREVRPPTMTFNNVPVQRTRPAPEEQVYKRWTGEPPAREIYLQDVSLEPGLEREQARQTITSILNDYRDNAPLQAFYQDVRRATGRDDIDLAALSGENLGKLMTRYPQLRQVMAQHAQDPRFAQTLQEIFSNPQFARSVAVLQGAAEEKAQP